MEAAKAPKKLKGMPYPPPKKLLKRKENNITPAKTNAPISQTSSERLKLTLQTYWIRNNDLKMKLGQVQEEISKIFLTVRADLSNDFKSIILETDQWIISPFLGLLWEEQQKYQQSSQNSATYHPMNPDTNATYQTVNLFSSDKCFIYFISDVPHYIWWNQHSTI